MNVAVRASRAPIDRAAARVDADAFLGRFRHSRPRALVLVPTARAAELETPLFEGVTATTRVGTAIAAFASLGSLRTLSGEGKGGQALSGLGLVAGLALAFFGGRVLWRAVLART